MISLFKKLIFNISINTIFFLILIIGIQNSTNKAKVSLLIIETVKLPISFIIGTSFISGSLLGGFIPLDFLKKSRSS
tara:strand:- start:32 stop:262 length:231 start_codon:yes stop_codon:yes gene_type:complete